MYWICWAYWLSFLAMLALGNPAFASAMPMDAVQEFFPQAGHVGEYEGDPPAAAVYRDGDLLGYVFRTQDVAPLPAYSGKPVNLLVGIDTEGRITGATVLEHHEPILLVGIPEERLDRFAGAHAGMKINERVHVGQRGKGQHVDAISGATVTVMVVNETIMQAARRVARANGILEPASGHGGRRHRARLRQGHFQQADWEALTGNGAIRRLHLARGAVDDAFVGTEAEGVNAAVESERNETFIDLYYTYLNLPVIGRNLLGDEQYRWLREELQENEHAIAVMGRGEYSFKGSGYVRGGIFDRVQLVQDGQTITFRDLDHHRLADVYLDGMPEFDEMAIFIVRGDKEFDPARTWELEVLVRRPIGPLDTIFTSFNGAYQLPDTFLEPRAEPASQSAHAAAAEQAMWVEIWHNSRFRIAILIAGLTVLTLILLFQDVLVRRPRLVSYIRTGFLLYTLFFIGWYALAQLSVVNVFTFINAIITDFRWATFLMDPLIFILWSFVAVTLLLWGRGIYCGWLCPFGALQELVNKLARRLRVPQYRMPFAVHERLWALKYVILLVLFGMSLQSVSIAERYAEVEPFKTAITLRFQRDWGYLLYALALVLISAFNSKFYCRYVCPLGAALVVPGRLRLFDWLKRHPQDCGKPCQICANECEVQAIHPDGRINANECHYCLDCQMSYWNDRKCPPMVRQRKRLERRLQRGQPAEAVIHVEKHRLAANGASESIEKKAKKVPVN